MALRLILCAITVALSIAMVRNAFEMRKETKRMIAEAFAMCMDRHERYPTAPYFSEAACRERWNR